MIPWIIKYEYGIGVDGMRVALFTDTFLPDVNGVAKTLGRWTKFLESKGAECKVFAPTSITAGETDFFQVERFLSIPFLLYPECRLAIPNPLHIRRILQAFNPTIIHCATPFNLGLSGMHYALKHRIPLVASYHTHFDQYLSHYKIQWAEPALWKYMLWFHQYCRKVYVPSQSALEHLESKGLNDLEIWGRGVETDHFSPEVDRDKVLASYGIDSSNFIILYVGRLAPEKSIDVLTETLNSLDPLIRKKVHLIIAGDGPISAVLHEQYSGSRQVTFTGFVQGKPLSDLYAAADCFFFPSTTETFGNVVLEAMASGTPVIGAAAGGVKDNVQHGVTGLLCPPGDVSAFVEATELLYSQPELRRSLGMQGRAYSLQQSWDSIFMRLLDSYKGAIMDNSATEPYPPARMIR
jgi:glycosyltransferase involved in cell wall biosynthesis